MKIVYVISDLHLGGNYSIPPDRGARGFRLCTRPDAIARFVDSLTGKFGQEGTSELVLNGDTIDFLAEMDQTAPPSWSSFTSDPAQAVAKFEAIVKRDRDVFAALNRFLEKGGRLTVLLGNHDIELSLPLVRAAFRRALGIKPGHDFEFLYDGEAYVVGDALIEHGNRYDIWNQIDYDALRHVRSSQSRRQEVPSQYVFIPPAGSEMVATVINKIKIQYPFVDLLKPETAVVIPMLLALEPGYRSFLGTVAKLAYQTRRHGLATVATPAFGGHISAGHAREENAPVEGGTGVTGFGGEMAGSIAQFSSEEEKALELAVKSALGVGAGRRFLDDLDGELAGLPGQFGADISTLDTVNRTIGFLGLLRGGKTQSISKRLPALLRAMQGLQPAAGFDVNKETASEYLEAARKLADGGFRYVLFGHTHHPKKVDLGNGRWYLNSGTWADVLKFPGKMLEGEPDALQSLETFVAKMKAGDFSEWTLFDPTYIRLTVDLDKVVEAELLCFSEGTSAIT